MRTEEYRFSWMTWISRPTVQTSSRLDLFAEASVGVYKQYYIGVYIYRIVATIGITMILISTENTDITDDII